MKLKRYEKKKTIFFCSLVLFFLILLFLFYLFYTKTNKYRLINGVVRKDNLAELIVSDTEYKRLSKTRYIYVDGKKKKYKIDNIIFNVLKRDKIKFHSVLINFKIDGEYKVNDNIEVVFSDEKVSLISMFKVIWKGEFT